MIDRGDDSEFKDVLVQVQEAPTWGVRLRPGINPGGEVVVGLVVEERNFDPLGWPTCLADILEGRAFRGAGHRAALEVVRVPVLPCRVPFLSVLDRFMPPAGGLRLCGRTR